VFRSADQGELNQKVFTVRMSSEICCYVLLRKVSHLPVEMLEMILIRAFMMLHSSDDDDANDSRPFTFDNFRSAQCRVFTVLCSVCWPWWYTIRGWPQSPTRHWVKHRLIKLMERKCTWMLTHTHTHYILDLSYIVPGFVPSIWHLLTKKN